jgi:predicted kinase
MKSAAKRADAAHVRIDTIEDAIVRFAAREDSDEGLRHAVRWGLGYDIAYAVAGDLLRQGAHVFAECVNPMKITREAWRRVADATGYRVAVQGARHRWLSARAGRPGP